MAPPCPPESPSSTTAPPAMCTRSRTPIAEGAPRRAPRCASGGSPRSPPRPSIRENADWRAHARRRRTGRRGHAGRPRMGRRLRLRHADALRQPRRPAQAVHRHRRAAVGGGQARRQGGHELHVGGQRARRPGVDDPRPEQRLLPLGLDHHPAGLHRRAALRGGRQPLRHVVRRRPGRRRPRRRDPYRRAHPGPSPRAASPPRSPAPGHRPSRPGRIGA